MGRGFAGRRWRLFVATVLAFGVAAAAGAASRPYLDIRVFTKVGQPGQPEPVAIGPDRRVYVGTNQLGHGDTDAPSRVFAYSLRGRLVRQYVLKGQPLDENHGIQGLAFDRNGLLYALDRSANPRVVRIDPATGRQRVYSRFRDVAPCSGPSTGNCSQTIQDLPAGPDYAAFGPGGALYVTDIDQALIWKVPKGGGRPAVWLTDARFESLYGPNGIQFQRDGRTLLFVNTASNPGAGNSFTGRIYRVRVGRGGRPAGLEQVWESQPLDAPDGLAIARSGRIYVALAGASQVLVLARDFTEIARVPPDPVANEQEEIPLDGPGSAAFLGRRLLVSNHSPVRGDPESWAILDVWTGERGLPLFRPRIVKPRLRLRARAAQRRGLIRVRVTRTLASRRVGVAGAIVRAAGEKTRTGRGGRGTLRFESRLPETITVIARKRGFIRAVRRLRPAG